MQVDCLMLALHKQPLSSIFLLSKLAKSAFRRAATKRRVGETPRRRNAVQRSAASAKRRVGELSCSLDERKPTGQNYTLLLLLAKTIHIEILCESTVQCILKIAELHNKETLLIIFVNEF